MKKLILLLGLVFTFGMANAQSAEQPTNEQRAHSQAMNLKKRLSLSDDQLAKVENIYLSGFVAIDAIKQDVNKNDAQKKNEIANVKTSKELELKGVLTADQWAQYEAMKQQRAERAAQSGQ